MPYTKTQFLAEYRDALSHAFPWAQNAARLDAFMASVENTIRRGHNTWHHDSQIATILYRAKSGNRGKVTLKWLRALPD